MHPSALTIFILPKGQHLAVFPLVLLHRLINLIFQELNFPGLSRKSVQMLQNLKLATPYLGLPDFLLDEKGPGQSIVVVKKDTSCRKPGYLTHSEAAACVGSGVTACAAVIQGCNLQQHHKILIIGASGALGTFAVQIAKHKGAYIIAVCSKKNKALVESLGADEVIDYTTTSFVEVLSKENSNSPDFVVDFVGGKEIEKDSMKILKKSGTFITLVGPVRYLGDKHLGWMGIVKILMYIGWRMFHSLWKKPKYKFVGATTATYSILIEILKTKSIKPIIDKTIDFNEKDIGEAIKYVRTHRATGRVVRDLGSDQANILFLRQKFRIWGLK